jgi:hypothetical protein
MKKILGVVLVIIVAATLTGCESLEARKQSQDLKTERERSLIQLGKECQDAGGVWEYDSFLGNWTCSFVKNKEK